MDCTTTTTKAGRRGFTLVEYMVASGISGMAILAITALFFYSSRSFAAIGNYVDLDSKSRNALDVMARDIRQAAKLTSYATNELDFQMVDPGTGATNTLSYVYSSSTATLSRIYGGLTNTLLTQINPNSLNFTMYQRNPVGGAVDQYQTTNVTLCKVIQLNWICSRSLMGLSGNSESVQSAKIMIRKE